MFIFCVSQGIYIYIYIYIYISFYIQTVSLYHKLSVLQDKRHVPIWVRSPAYFMSGRYLTTELSSFSAVVKEFFLHIY